MERLTDKNAVGNYFYPKCFEKCDGLGASSKCDNCEIMTSICEKLGKYEDLEEQGRLVKLPCKVGDTVWQIMVVGVQGKNIKYGIFKAVVTKISADYQMNFLLSTITEDKERYRNEVTSTAIGDTMFFTKSEAEAKLKELRGGENDRETEICN
jgi:hypothetical protein